MRFASRLTWQASGKDKVTASFNKESACLCTFAGSPTVAPEFVGSYHFGTSAWSIDFDGNFYKPAQEIVSGSSTYHPAALEHVRQAVANGHKPDEFQKFEDLTRKLGQVPKSEVYKKRKKP